MSSTKSNGVWVFIELPSDVKAMGCKWVFETKKDSLDNIKRYETRLVSTWFVSLTNLYTAEHKRPINDDNLLTTNDKGLLDEEAYINKILERLWMKNCSSSVAPIVKCDRFNLNQCLKNDLEREQMKSIPYPSVVKSLIYSVAIFIVKNNKSCSQSKHIIIKYLATREYIKEKKVVIEYISTKLMIADHLTKDMLLLKFKHRVEKIGLSSAM
ncbi:uncharacterized protein LOC111409567 [Olea europaea var. sylvestris]|uniref:uncharacterized protein LOC111409567 n=1 Tax=Olea europaea var. sylvestris TaxID=158386 RepID=UPI000C1D13EF|nr:uncharacterized protein LOC111409567 [Olea europaea var. sylvestris]